MTQQNKSYYMVAHSMKDGGYIGLPQFAKKIDDMGIMPECIVHTKETSNGLNIEIKKNEVCSIGFCEREQRWYGWSHRAMASFGIGSKVKKGDCGYIPTDEEDAKENSINFWKEESHKNFKYSNIKKDEDGLTYFDITWEYCGPIENKKLIGTIGSYRHYVLEFGRGEWEAKTLKDAKQMAIDFAKGVS